MKNNGINCIMNKSRNYNFQKPSKSNPNIKSFKLNSSLKAVSKLQK